METLAPIYRQAREKLSEQDIVAINKRLLLLYQLSTLQLNISYEIEWMLRDKGGYNFTVKNNHKRLKSFISGNVNNEFWKNLTQEQLDVMAEDADDLESIIYKWADIEPYNITK